MRKMILIALLLPTWAMAGPTASQAAYLQYRACLISAVAATGNTASAGAAFATARSKCVAQRAKLSADIIAELRGQGRPESLARRISEDAVTQLESGLRDDLVRPAGETR